MLSVAKGRLLSVCLFCQLRQSAGGQIWILRTEVQTTGSTNSPTEKFCLKTQRPLRVAFVLALQ